MVARVQAAAGRPSGLSTGRPNTERARVPSRPTRTNRLRDGCGGDGTRWVKHATRAQHGT